MNEGGLWPQVYNQKSSRQALFLGSSEFGTKHCLQETPRREICSIQSVINKNRGAPGVRFVAPLKCEFDGLPHFSSSEDVLRKIEFVVPLFSVWSILAGIFFLVH